MRHSSRRSVRINVVLLKILKPVQAPDHRKWPEEAKALTWLAVIFEIVILVFNVKIAAKRVNIHVSNTRRILSYYRTALSPDDGPV